MKEGIEGQQRRKEGEEKYLWQFCDGKVFHYTVKTKQHFHSAVMPQSRHDFTRNPQAWLAGLEQAERTSI